MRFAVATLCDSATVREGLLNILGGGITTVRLPRLSDDMTPILGANLAVTVEFSDADLGDHRFTAEVIRLEDGAVVHRMSAGITVVRPPDAVEGTPINVSTVVPFQMLPVPAEGVYAVKVGMDDDESVILPVSVAFVPPPAGMFADEGPAPAESGE